MLQTLRRCRHILSVFACTIGTSCIVLASTRLSAAGDEHIAESVLLLSSGLVQLLYSLCIIVSNSCSDNINNDILESAQRHNANLKQSIDYLQRENSKYLELNKEASALLERTKAVAATNAAEFRANITELENKVTALDGVRNTYVALLNENKLIAAQLENEVRQLHELSDAQMDELERLRTLASEQRQQIDALSKQAENLNRLQRESVRMIQQLALYGDECREFNVSLKDISKDLRDTDTSLGLTAKEMGDQLNALASIVSALERTDKSLRSMKSSSSSLSLSLLSSSPTTQGGAHQTQSPDDDARTARHSLDIV